MKYTKCCICEQEIDEDAGCYSLNSGRVHIVCANGAENYAHELARINEYSLPEFFPRKGLVNHFRDNLEADSITKRASR
jgi:hypothetical protein